ncbi:MAG: alpha/beta fold hydrolase [Anaerolineae bacterium]|nr:alpha/beta fold hydrolase [Anaerolineae bacterium]MDK1081080.1 alpha/beta fold hydrolase [Anaerolineae bacterium]
MKFTILSVVFLVLFGTACSRNASGSAIETEPAISLNTSTPALTPVPTNTTVPTLTYTPEPYWEYSIEYLRLRAYGSGKIEITERLGQNSAFTRYYFRYPSDGLNIYGFVNVPHGEGPFPVIIALHGYIDPGIYQTLDYTTHYADTLASTGYLVLHPNLRGYPPSDEGDNLFRVGMAIDVLNLIALVKEHSGEPGLLQFADSCRIGLWGHSMGAGVSTRVLTVSQDISAAVLYAAMSGDERKNFEAIQRWSNFSRGFEELAVPAELLSRISPNHFFENITAPVSIHHGLEDKLIPVAWSMQTCEHLKALGNQVECHYYETMPHTFYGPGDKEFIQQTIQFYDRYLVESNSNLGSQNLSGQCDP